MADFVSPMTHVASDPARARSLLRSRVSASGTLTAIMIFFSGGCGSSSTTVRVAIAFEDVWGLDAFEVRVSGVGGTRRHASGATREMLLVVPDEWAGRPTSIAIDASRGGALYAGGDVIVSAVRGAEVRAVISLARIPCGAWCTGTSTMCDGNAVSACVERADSCREWGPSTACGAGTSCSLGSCGATCIDECVGDAARCDGPRALRRCGEAGDGDGCREWLAIEPCDANETCSSGSCRSTCTSECVFGARECSGRGFVTCGDLNRDGCMEWSPVTECPPALPCREGVCGEADAGMIDGGVTADATIDGTGDAAASDAATDALFHDASTDGARIAITLVTSVDRRDSLSICDVTTDRANQPVVVTRTSRTASSVSHVRRRTPDGSWRSVQIGSRSDQYAGCGPVAVDSVDRIVTTYQEGPSIGSIELVRVMGSSIERTTIDTGYGAVDLRLDAADAPHVVYRRSSDFWYARWTGAAFATEIVTPIGSPSRWVSGFALDGTGSPIVTVTDEATRAILLGSRTTTGWTFSSVRSADPFNDVVAFGVDSAGVWHVAYSENHTDLVVLSGDETPPRVETVTRIAMSRYLYLGDRDLDTNPLGISYLDWEGSMGNRVAFARRTPSGWITETIEEGFANTPIGASDSVGRMHVFYTFANGTELELRYALIAAL